MKLEYVERLLDFTPEELIDMLEIGAEDIIDRFPDRIDEDQLPWLFDEGL